MAGKRPKKKKTGIIIFVIELIVLMILVAGIFVLARINSGLRNIGTATGQGGSGKTSSGAVTAPQNNNTEAVEGTEAEPVAQTG